MGRLPPGPLGRDRSVDWRVHRSSAGVVVLLLWIPLRQRPGIGTVANVVLVGLTLDAVLLLIPPTADLGLRWAYLVAGIVLNGIATGAYIGAGLGPGPRDGLMVGLARDGRSLRVVLTAIEVSVLILGWLLGGTVGIGTVLFALTIGPIVHRTVPAFSRHAVRVSAGRVPRDVAAARSVAQRIESWMEDRGDRRPRRRRTPSR